MYWLLIAATSSIGLTCRRSRRQRGRFPPREPSVGRVKGGSWRLRGALVTLNAPSGKRIAVILAAGEGRRMGFTKALLEFAEGERFLRRLASVFASSGCEVLAVTGHQAAGIAAAHADLTCVENAGWDQGQLSSARVGIARALAAKASVVLAHPVDAPAIRAATLRILLSP